jgi:hypothetical protein
VVRPSDKTAGGSGFTKVGGNSVTVENCAVFGFSNFNSGTVSGLTGSNNCSDQTIGFGSSNQASKTYANQFQNTLDASQDFRLKTGADCFDTGVTDTTNLPAANDIANTSRPQSTAWDIGCWELIVAAPATPQFQLMGQIFL